MARDAKHNYVLVHGTNHGGWCWGRVADTLTGNGHRVYAPSLTGCGDRVHLLTADTSLDTHIADIVNIILWQELTDVILCGHSYGGWVVSGVVEQVPDRIRSIVYLDAFMPNDGQRGLDLQSPGSVEGVLRARERGELSRPPGNLDRYRINQKDRPWVESMLTPQPIGVSLQPIKLTGARDRVPQKVFIRATEYDHPHFGSYYEKLSQHPDWQVFALACGHDVMIDMPDELSSILLGLVD